MSVSAGSPLAFAVRHINASAKIPVDQDTLLAALLADRAPEAWAHHVRAFYDETDVETLSDLVRSGDITYDRLAGGARACLPPGHETRQWLDERG